MFYTEENVLFLTCLKFYEKKKTNTTTLKIYMFFVKEYQRNIDHTLDKNTHKVSVKKRGHKYFTDLVKGCFTSFIQFYFCYFEVILMLYGGSQIFFSHKEK